MRGRKLVARKNGPARVMKCLYLSPELDDRLTAFAGRKFDQSDVVEMAIDAYLRARGS